jgi:hypothetical protein
MARVSRIRCVRPLASHSAPLPPRQRKDLLVSAVLEGLSAGALLRAVHYDLLDEPRANLRDCLRRVDGAELVRTGVRLGGGDSLEFLDCSCGWAGGRAGRRRWIGRTLGATVEGSFARADRRRRAWRRASDPVRHCRGNSGDAGPRDAGLEGRLGAR